MSDLDYLPKIESVYKNLVKYVQQGININGWGDLPEVHVFTSMNHRDADKYYTFHLEHPIFFVKCHFYLDGHIVEMDWCPIPHYEDGKDPRDGVVSLNISIGVFTFEYIYNRLYALLEGLESKYGSAYNSPKHDYVKILDYGCDEYTKTDGIMEDPRRYVVIEGSTYAVNPVPVKFIPESEE